MQLLSDNLKIADKDIARAVDAELARVQRRGGMTYACVFFGLSLLLLVGGIVGWAMREQSLMSAANLPVAASALGVLLHAVGFLVLWKVPAPRRRIVVAFLMLAALGMGYQAAYWFAVATTHPQLHFPPTATPTTPLVVFGGVALLIGVLMIRHMIASRCVPLARRPALTLAVIMAVTTAVPAAIIAGPDNILLAAAAVGGCAVAVLPGLWGTTSRYAEQVERAEGRFYGGRYHEVRLDLAEARRLHSSLFPSDLLGGRVELAYLYEPRREIGGDFLFANRISDDIVVAAVVDVTGHGIASALAVTRIHDELLRLTSSPAGTSPSAVIAGLHRFTHLYLAPHNVFATAFCVVADAAEGRLRWCSAGHPPAFLRRAAGAVDMLDSTAMMLGAVRCDQYEIEERESPFAPGDALVVFTDGVIEADAEIGRAFGVDRARRAVQDADARGPAQSLMDAVRAHRETHASDDALAVEVRRVI